MSIFYKGKQIAGNEVTLSEIKIQSKEEIKNIQKEGVNQLAILSKKVEEAVGVAIGTYLDIASDTTYTPSGYLLRDGAEYNGNQFQNLWDNWLFSIPIYTADSNVTIPMEYGHYDGSLYWNTSYQARMPISVPHDANGFMYGDVDIVIKTENYKTTTYPRADYMFEFYNVSQGGVLVPNYAYLSSSYNSIDKLTYLSINSNVTGLGAYNIASLASDSEYTIKITNGTSAHQYNLYLIDKNGISQTLCEDAYYNMENFELRPSGFGYFIIDRCKYVNANGKNVYFASISSNSKIKTLNYDEYDYQIKQFGYCDNFAIEVNRLSTYTKSWKTGSTTVNYTKLGENYPTGITLTFTYNGTTWDCTDGNSYTREEMSNLCGFAPASNNTSIVVGDNLTASYDPTGKFRTPLANPNTRTLVKKKEPTGSDPTWYNLYSDGWCEQGGVTTPSSTTANKEIVLGVEYRDINYQVLIGNEYTASATSVSCVVTSTKTTTGFTIADAKNTAYYTYWRTQGYTNQVVDGSTRPYVVVANGELNESDMNWSKWATSLEGKANANLSNCTRPYVTEASDKSLLPSWYRIWSDGWCEQGGIITGGASNTGAEVVLLKPLQLGYYITSYVLGDVTSFPNAASIWCKCTNISTTSFYIASGYTGASSTAYQAYNCSWEAKGYLN